MSFEKVKLEKDKKWGFYICPKCGLPMRYRYDPDSYKCDIIWNSELHGCGFAIGFFFY